MKNKTILSFIGFTLAISACSKSTTPVAAPASTITGGVTVVKTGVAKVGSMGAVTAYQAAPGDSHQLVIPALTPLAAAMCDVHGSPQYPAAEGGGSMNQSDTRYPGVAIYCALTVDDGDTVIGGFGLARSLICALEAGGIQFAGATQSITMNFANTDCWPKGAPGGGTTGTAVISAVGTAPAVFNTHYTKGVAFTVAALGLDYKIAANIDGDKIEFIAYENWNGDNAGDSKGNTGVMAGEITKSTGVLKYEKRDERIRASCTNSSCGWNRHTRILANLTMSGGNPTGVTSFQYAYGNDWITSAAVLDPTVATDYGIVITGKGTVATQVKARLFAANGQNAAGIKTVGNWTETPNTTCISKAGATNTDCATETGIGKFTSSTKFNLYAGTAQTSPLTWLNTFSGFLFTNVDLDVDNAF